MNNDLGNIILDGKNIYLNLASIDELKTILKKLDSEEMNVKRELDDILSNLT